MAIRMTRPLDHGMSRSMSSWFWLEHLYNAVSGMVFYLLIIIAWVHVHPSQQLSMSLPSWTVVTDMIYHAPAVSPVHVTLVMDFITDVWKFFAAGSSLIHVIFRLSYKPMGSSQDMLILPWPDWSAATWQGAATSVRRESKLWKPRWLCDFVLFLL